MRKDKLWIGILPAAGVIALVGYLFLSGYLFGETIPPTGQVKEFSISARTSEFNVTRIEVNAGDTVILKITSLDDGSGNGHGFAISAFGVNKAIGNGQTTTIEFVANKRGTFTFLCSVPCGPKHSSMTGTLIVK